MKFSSIGTVVENTTGEVPEGMIEQQLSIALAEFKRVSVFGVGDIVRWKPNMVNKRMKGPFIVVEILKTPIIDTAENPGSAYFQERLDVRLGSFDVDGDFLICLYDSHRMER